MKAVGNPKMFLSLKPRKGMCYMKKTIMLLSFAFVVISLSCSVAFAVTFIESMKENAVKFDESPKGKVVREKCGVCDGETLTRGKDSTVVIKRNGEKIYVNEFITKDKSMRFAGNVKIGGNVQDVINLSRELGEPEVMDDGSGIVRHVWFGQDYALTVSSKSGKVTEIGGMFNMSSVHMSAGVNGYLK